MPPSPRVLALVTVPLLALTACSESTAGAPSAPASQAPTTKKGVDLRGFTPSDTNRDPTSKIDGVVEKEYAAGLHVQSPRRVAYDVLPPFGGAHDAVWAACNGVVYPEAVRTEHLVHSLEHGAVWISYEPGKLSASDVESLAALVDGKPYLVMSPFPGQAEAVAVQSWGRQLRTDDAADERIVQFIAATRGNQYLAPEPGASCDALGAPLFDQDAPPPFDPSPPGPDAMAPTGP